MSTAVNEVRDDDARILAIIRLRNNLSLLFIKPGPEPGEYPSCRVQKGLVIASNGRELVEEGVGLGLPIVKFGLETVFPGDASLSMKQDGKRIVTTVSYNLNLIRRTSLRWGGVIGSPRFYEVEEFLSGLHRQHPLLRNALTWTSYPVKLLCGMTTAFQENDSAGPISVIYDADIGQGIIHISVDLKGLTRRGCTEVIIANEQGANRFDLYRDSDGITLRGKGIGTWDEAVAHSASLADSRDGISFS
ncbi:MAG: hypothetical protein U1B77_01270, partial [Dehalococcoidales bacterium]|nr:hypothetical protein [Dehalococcoidales bacterium]